MSTQRDPRPTEQKVADERALDNAEAATAKPAERTNPARAIESELEQLREAARALRRACHDANSPVVPVAVAEAIATVCALGALDNA